MGMPLRTFMRKVPPHAVPAPQPARDLAEVVDLVGRIGLPAAATQLGLAPKYVANLLRKASRGA